MAILKCKMCGGDLNVVEGSTLVECEYCGTRQTVPCLDNEKKMSLFNRANRLRFACEFDKASGVYESIVTDFPEEAEAYWGLVLCKYGIEYVDDPKTGKKIPTCHRSSFDSVFENDSFEMVMENADVVAKPVYREEAKAIEELRKGIIEVSSKEEPYDIFICYKETAPDGDRTVDSVIAQEVYEALTEKGYRVFFSRITLEDKLGQEYEPFIFAALNSAKIMLAFGSDYEYYNAVWVKNEWSRFLELIEKGEKKTLIPCFKGIDAYDMPKEFARLQAQDMGKVGAIQDLLRGIEKVLPRDSGKTVVKEVAVDNSLSTEPILKRAKMFMDEGEFSKADELCEMVLNLDLENPTAYLYKLMCEFSVKEPEALAELETKIDGSANYEKVLKYADAALSATVKGYAEKVNDRLDKKRLAELDEKYTKLVEREQAANTSRLCDEIIGQYRELDGYKDSAERIRLIEAKKAELVKREKAKKKKIIIIASSVAAVFIIAISLVIYHITGELVTVNGVQYQRGEGEYIVVDYTDSYGGIVVIEKEIRRKPVTKIAEKAFSASENLTSVTLPDSLIEIRDSAFSGCEKLISVTISNSVKNIGNSAFFGCKTLENITIPDSVTSIGNSAFRNCQSLTEITIPSSVTEIGEYAFSNCDKLKRVELPEGLLKINKFTFYHCEALKYVKIPSTVNEIGESAFYLCSALSEVEFVAPNGWVNQNGIGAWFVDKSEAAKLLNDSRAVFTKS